MKVRLRRPFFPPDSISKIQERVEEVLKNGRLTLGPYVETFENKFAKFEGMKNAVGVTSATAGLHLCMLALNIKKGDEVIVPSKTFISTANSVLYCNAKPVFCDVDEQSYQLDPQKLEKLITKKTRAIIPVHLGGNMCKMDQILEIASKKNIPIVEDCAHAHGSTFHGRKSGTFGQLGVFSLYPDKIMASSDGGMIVTNDPVLYEKIQLLRNVGRKKLGQDTFLEIGYNYRMNELQAILALEQLRILPKMISRRREVARIYDSAFGGIEKLERQHISPFVKSSYYAYIMRLKIGNLEKFLNKLTENGVEQSLMFISIYKHKVYEKIFGKRLGLCPISEKLDEQTFTIPLHAGITANEIQHVIKMVKKAIG